MARHRLLTLIFYATILPHVVGQLLGWAVIASVALTWAVWRWRDPMRANLATWMWPIRGRKPAAAD